jgi:S-adenosylmethionine:tRNA ribosyltransferase-isomerase
MVMDRAAGTLLHRRFRDVVEFLREGDLLVFNDSRVLPARLKARRAGSGGLVEILLLRRTGPGAWETLVRPAKRIRAGERLELDGDSGRRAPALAEVVRAADGGIREIVFEDESALPGLGEIALPPYIHAPLAEPERYQTVYAHEEGSVAAPTAGLHFTPELLDSVRARGVRCAFVTLHIGLDTFRPVEEADPRRHAIHTEYGVVGPEAAEEIASAQRDGRRVICVGTTAVRLVEAAALAGPSGIVAPLAGWVDLFIMPGYRFRAVDAMITNFHLPRSTLLMLVSAFAGRERVLDAYREAATLRYRFYSFGDCMLVL